MSNLIEAIKSFAETHIKPFSRQWDRDNYFPKHLVPELGKLGVLGIFLPKKYGAANLTYTDYADVLVELAKADPSISLTVAAHNSILLSHIYQFGNEEQKDKYLPKLVSGEYLGAWALTEINAGSDAGAMTTEATFSDDN